MGVERSLVRCRFGWGEWLGDHLILTKPASFFFTVSIVVVPDD